MKSSHTMVQRFAQVLFALGFLTVPLAFAYASVSVSIQSLSPSTSVTVGTNVSFTVSNSGFSNPIYSISDSVSGSSVGSGNINSSGNFSWTPNSNDVGTHNLSIAVNDSSGDSATTTETLTVSAAPSVSIQSLSPSSAVTIGQTVSFTVAASGFTNPTYSVNDSLSGSTVVNGDINSSGNFSWVPATQDAGTHTITVTVHDAQNSASVTEQITVSAAPTLVIQSLSPGSSVNVGQTLTLTAAASGFSSPSYSISDSFSGTTLSSNNINSSGNLSWMPSSSDVGTHAITVTASDGSGHTATASQTITVGGSGASIQGLSPGSTVVVGNPVTFTVAASGFSSPVFSISDSFGGSNISNSSINTAGYFTWTPDSSQVGTHNLTIYVNDPSGHSGNTTLALTVQTPNITITSITPGTVVAPNSPLSFTMSQAGFVNPTYTLSDSFSGTTITNSNINASGYFTWTPATNQSGSHIITVYATDSAGHSANTSITVSVNSGVSVALTAPTPSSSVAPGTTVVFSSYAYGFTSPSYTLQDSFGGSSITNADINSSGYFSWTPTNADAGTHTITVTATDPYSHLASAQTTLVVAAGSQNVTTTSSSAVITDYLYPGLTSSEVTALQNILIKDGYLSAAATGYYGSLTEAAVVAFQAAHGIQQLGVVGPATRAALNSAQSSSTTTTTADDGFVFNNFLSVGSTGNDVTELQKRLTTLGVYSGPITGYFGSLTQAAVDQFQGAHGISRVGYVGPTTRAALNQ